MFQKKFFDQSRKFALCFSLICLDLKIDCINLKILFEFLASPDSSIISSTFLILSYCSKITITELKLYVVDMNNINQNSDCNRRYTCCWYCNYVTQFRML